MNRTFKIGDIIVPLKPGVYDYSERGIITEVIYKTMRAVVKWDGDVIKKHRFSEFKLGRLVHICPYKEDFLEKIKERLE